MPLTYRDIAEILEALDKSDCEELIIESGGSRLVYRKYGVSEREIPPAVTPSAASSASVGVPAGAATPRASDSEATGRHIVRAPSLGTFYRAPSPGDPPFVEEGRMVKAGDPLCLIEVMKLYNTIAAPFAGRVQRILAENGALVEYDQPIFLMEPAA